MLQDTKMFCLLCFAWSQMSERYKFTNFILLKWKTKTHTHTEQNVHREFRECISFSRCTVNFIGSAAGWKLLCKRYSSQCRTLLRHRKTVSRIHFITIEKWLMNYIRHNDICYINVQNFVLNKKKTVIRLTWTLFIAFYLTSFWFWWWLFLRLRSHKYKLFCVFFFVIMIMMI